MVDDAKEDAVVYPLDTDPRFRSTLPRPEVAQSTRDFAAALGLRLPDDTEPRFFRFRRSRDRGTRIYIRHGRLTYLMNDQVCEVPRMTFAEARVWARAYAAAHGFTFRETREFC